jgi:hypothetical protein
VELFGRESNAKRRRGLDLPSLAPAFHLTRVGGGWVVPGGRLVVRLPKGETTYELEAAFKKAGPDSPTIGKASVKWWLKDGSRDRLVSEGGNFYWKPF